MEAEEEGIVLILFVPLRLRNDVVAVLMLYMDARIFPDEEITFVEAVADLSAQALENAQFCKWARRKEIEI